MRNFIVFMFSVLLVGLVTSCQNTPTPVSGPAITIAEDEVLYLKSADAFGEDITAASYGGHLASGDFKSGFVRFFPYKNFPDCAVVTVSGEDFPKEIVIDYGDECLTRNGVLISGKIFITISDRMINPGAEYSVVYEDVYFNEKGIEKASTIRNEGQNDEGNWIISHNIASSVNYGDTLIIARDFSGQKEWLNGFLTPEFTDNRFFRTGGGTITVNNDLVFERTIIEPLYIDRACRFILSGVVEISRNDEVMTIDFGDGDCDNIAVVTKDGESEEIELTTGRFRNTFKRHLRHLFCNQGWW